MQSLLILNTLTSIKKYYALQNFKMNNYRLDSKHQYNTQDITTRKYEIINLKLEDPYFLSNWQNPKILNFVFFNYFKYD